MQAEPDVLLTEIHRQAADDPILRLADPVDVLAYVRRLESVLMDVCADFGLPTIRDALHAEEFARLHGARD